MAVIQFISFWLGASWDFFTEVKVPGFDFSIAALFVGIFLATLGLRFVISMIGVSVSSGGITHIARENRRNERRRNS